MSVKVVPLDLVLPGLVLGDNVQDAARRMLRVREIAHDQALVA